MLLGAYVPTAGGLDLAPGRGRSLAADVIQISTRSQLQWAARPLEEDEAAAFRVAMTRSGLRLALSHLPPALREHLFDRLRERKISAEDLYDLKLWREPDPEAPDGAWYKDFGSFKLCGEGDYPRPFLLRGQPTRGRKL